MTGFESSDIRPLVTWNVIEWGLFGFLGLFGEQRASSSLSFLRLTAWNSFVMRTKFAKKSKKKSLMDSLQDRFRYHKNKNQIWNIFTPFERYIEFIHGAYVITMIIWYFCKFEINVDLSNSIQSNICANLKFSRDKNVNMQ